MKRDMEFFTDTEVELVQVSRRLKEALDVEERLTREGIDYVVEADSYPAKFLYLFPTTRVGAFFWVPAVDAARVRSLLSEAGITATWPEDGPEDGPEKPSEKLGRPNEEIS